MGIYHQLTEASSLTIDLSQEYDLRSAIRPTQVKRGLKWATRRGFKAAHQVRGQTFSPLTSL